MVEDETIRDVMLHESVADSQSQNGVKKVWKQKQRKVTKDKWIKVRTETDRFTFKDKTGLDIEELNNTDTIQKDCN